MKTSANRKFTRTFIRFIRRTKAVKVASKSHLWGIYRAGGKKAVLSLLNGSKVSPIKAQEVTEALALPASMPKGAAAKIAGYDDSRAGGGMIHIVLKSGYKFDTGLNIASVSTVKDAISTMRTATAV